MSGSPVCPAAVIHYSLSLSLSSLLIVDCDFLHELCKLYDIAYINLVFVVRFMVVIGSKYGLLIWDLNYFSIWICGM